jgi:hypothetical protein
MVKNDTTNSSDQLTTTSASQIRAVEIPNALPMHLQVLDLARHTVIAPDGRRFVVATFNDKHLGRGYVTAVYPQQNEYLTLVRMTVLEKSKATPEEAIKSHIALAQSIQHGRLKELNK